jgi:hypothetical protein
LVDVKVVLGYADRMMMMMMPMTILITVAMYV